MASVRRAEVVIERARPLVGLLVAVFLTCIVGMSTQAPQVAASESPLCASGSDSVVSTTTSDELRRPSEFHGYDAVAHRAYARLRASVGVLATKGADEGTEIVHRAMSRAELEATRKTGLVRGGRSGTHYVTDSANSSVLRARQRLALPQTPELIVGLRVPGGVFGAPTHVRPNFGMPGGGLERRGTGRVPCQIVEVRSC